MSKVQISKCRLIRVAKESFKGSKGDTIEFTPATIELDDGHIIKATVDKESADSLIDLRGNGTATLDIIEGNNNKPKVRLVDFSIEE
jgi:hypothetical protein